MMAELVTKKIQCENCLAALNIQEQWSQIIRCEYCGTEHILTSLINPIKIKDTFRFAVRLARAMATNFSLEEINHAIVELNEVLPARCPPVCPDDIVGLTRRVKARELALWCKRRNYLQYLVDTLVRLRPFFRVD